MFNIINNIFTRLNLATSTYFKFQLKIITVFNIDLELTLRRQKSSKNNNFILILLLIVKLNK